MEMKKNERLKSQIIILLFSFISVYCGSSPTGTSDSITINIPINKKAVRAIAYYNSFGNSDSLMHLRISSFYFDSTVTSSDTSFLFGKYERFDSDSPDNPLSGELIVSLTNEWVFFQSSEVFDAGVDLIKPFIISDVDTTYLPTELYGYFPIYPRTINKNETYSIYRPNNAGDGWAYADVYREFNVYNSIDWNDRYSQDSGFEVMVTHSLLGFTLYFDLVIDSHGIVNSYWSYVNNNISPEGAILDSSITHVVNRRIVDYSDPSGVLDLTHYANEVIENGLVFK
jgi:hypothetical protein